MKGKLNLTIDEQVIPKSKEYARRHGMSVSELVERLLRQTTEATQPSFSSRWRGKFRLSRRTDARTKALRERYLG